MTPWQFSSYWIVLCSGFLIGFLLSKRTKRDDAPSPAPVAMCPCGHTIGEHENEAYCQVEVRRRHYAGNGTENGYEWAQCPCTKYYGPQPLVDLFHPGMLLPPRPDAIFGGEEG